MFDIQVKALTLGARKFLSHLQWPYNMFKSYWTRADFSGRLLKSKAYTKDRPIDTFFSYLMNIFYETFQRE